MENVPRKHRCPFCRVYVGEQEKNLKHYQLYCQKIKNEELQKVYDILTPRQFYMERRIIIVLDEQAIQILDINTAMKVPHIKEFINNLGLDKTELIPSQKGELMQCEFCFERFPNKCTSGVGQMGVLAKVSHPMDKHLLEYHQDKMISFPNIKRHIFELIIKWVCNHTRRRKYRCSCGFKGSWDVLKGHDKNVDFEKRDKYVLEFKLSKISQDDWDLFKYEESVINDIVSAADFLDMKCLYKMALKCLTFIIIKRITQDSLTADIRMKKTFKIQTFECKQCGTTSNTWELYIAHNRDNHSEEPYYCPCDYDDGMSWEELQNHHTKKHVEFPHSIMKRRYDLYRIKWDLNNMWSQPYDYDINNIWFPAQNYGSLLRFVDQITEDQMRNAKLFEHEAIEMDISE